jgi:hypothetical protein
MGGMNVPPRAGGCHPTPERWAWVDGKTPWCFCQKSEKRQAAEFSDFIHAVIDDDPSWALAVIRVARAAML